MNFKKTTLALALAGAMTTPLAFADVKLSGKLDVLVVTGDDSSLDVQADDILVSLTASEKVGSVKWIADIDVDFAPVAEGQGSTTVEVDYGDGNIPTPNGTATPGDGADTVSFGTADVEAARIIAVGNFGAFVVGQSPSGIFADIYGPSDVMAENTDVFSVQGDQFNNAIAWKTPNLGPVYAVLASYSDGGDNDDIDIAVLRVVYKAHGLQVGAVILDYSDEFVAEDRTRTAIGGGYSNDMFSVGAFYEEDEKEFGTGDVTSEVTGFSATFSATDQLTLKASFEAVDNRGWMEGSENDVTALGFDYAISKNVTIYGETASYDVDGVDGSDNTLVGTVITF